MKQREEDKKKQDEEKNDREWKEKKKECKGWKWSRFRKSNTSGMHKRSKIKVTIKPDLTVSMKEARIERQIVKMLKPQLLSENKC